MSHWIVDLHSSETNLPFVVLKPTKIWKINQHIGTKDLVGLHEALVVFFSQLVICAIVVLCFFFNLAILERGSLVVFKTLQNCVKQECVFCHLSLSFRDLNWRVMSYTQGKYLRVFFSPKQGEGFRPWHLYTQTRVNPPPPPTPRLALGCCSPQFWSVFLCLETNKIFILVFEATYLLQQHILLF